MVSNRTQAGQPTGGPQSYREICTNGAQTVALHLAHGGRTRDEPRPAPAPLIKSHATWVRRRARRAQPRSGKPFGYRAKEAKFKKLVELRRRIKQMVGVPKPVRTAMPLGFQIRDEPWPLASDVPKWQLSAALLRQRNIEQERLVSF